MKKAKNTFGYIMMVAVVSLLVTACQKMERPPLGDYPEDPKPPALQILGAKSYWPFDGNTKDTGEFKLQSKTKNVSFVPGVTAIPDQVGGEAAAIGDKGFIVVTEVPEALKNPGSFSIAFWMKGNKGPVDGGAQGLFSVANSKQFWGNFEVFLENYKDPDDPNAAFIKMHLFNANVDGGGEVWVQGSEVKVKGVLDKWTHIAITYDAATSSISLYKDGAVTDLNGEVLNEGNYGELKWENVSGIALGTFAFQTTPNLTNHGPEGWARSFKGALDQFRIYTKALSAAEVKNLYDNKL